MLPSVGLQRLNSHHLMQAVTSTLRWHRKPDAGSALDLDGPHAHRFLCRASSITEVASTAFRATGAGALGHQNCVPFKVVLEGICLFPPHGSLHLLIVSSRAHSCGSACQLRSRSSAGCEVGKPEQRLNMQRGHGSLATVTAWLLAVQRARHAIGALKGSGNMNASMTWHSMLDVTQFIAKQDKIESS